MSSTIKTSTRQFLKKYSKSASSKGKLKGPRRAVTSGDGFRSYEEVNLDRRGSRVESKDGTSEIVNIPTV